MISAGIKLTKGRQRDRVSASGGRGQNKSDKVGGNKIGDAHAQTGTRKSSGNIKHKIIQLYKLRIVLITK